jgi:hypothetical protein
MSADVLTTRVAPALGPFPKRGRWDGVWKGETERVTCASTSNQILTNGSVR